MPEKQDNSFSFFDDQDLLKLDDYKSLNLIKSINECNLYVQSGAMITLLDEFKGDLKYSIRDTKALANVMGYVNNDSVPKEAIVAVMYNLYKHITKHKIKVDSSEYLQIGFAINVLQQILYKTTVFAVYVSNKGFTPEIMINDKKQKVKKKDVLYYLGKNDYVDEATNTAHFEVSTYFNIVSGNWCYLLDDENDNLTEINLKTNDIHFK